MRGRLPNLTPCPPALLVLLLGAVACGPSGGPRTDGESHLWLAPCDVDADCDSEQACVCGVCTWPCGGDSACPVAGRCLSTVSGPGEEACLMVPAAPGAICLPGCVDDDDCPPETGAACRAGACVPFATLPPGCSVAVEPAGEWTPGFTAQDNCDCTAAAPQCHSLYRVRGEAGDDGSVVVSFQKADSSGNPEPSAPVQAWVVVDEDALGSCLNLGDLARLTESTWAAGPVHPQTVPWTALRRAGLTALGEAWLGVMTGGGTEPDRPRWYSLDNLRVVLRCTP